jgi:hypothetical protein
MTHDEDPYERVQRSFERQGLMRHWGATVQEVSVGKCVLSLPYSD